MPRASYLDQFLQDLISDPLAAIGKTIPRVIERRNPELAHAVRVMSKIAEKSAGTMRVDNVAQQQFLKDLKDEGYGIWPIIGVPGSGKTTMAVWLARYINNPNNYCMGMNEYQRPPDFKRLNSMQEVLTVPEKSTVILDDFAQLASIYMYGHKADSQAMINFVTSCRHMKLTVIVTGQNTATGNIHILDVLDTFFFKTPPLSAQLERPAIRKMFPLAQEFFYGKTKQFQQSHCFVWSTKYIGPIRYQATEVR